MGEMHLGQQLPNQDRNSQGERKRERILIDQANMLVRRYLCTVFFGRRLRLCVSRWSALFGARKQFELYDPCSISRCEVWVWPMHFSRHSEYATENSLRLNMQRGAFRVFFLIPKSSETHFGDDVKYHGIQVQSKRSLTK